MDNPKELKHLSLCAGYGGIDLGLKRALGAVRTICFVEIEAFNIINLAKKIEAGQLDSAPIYTDLKTFPYSALNGYVDIISGGFPCQPFSSAGQRRGDDDPRHLWPFIREGVRASRPALVFLENVEGILSSRLNGDTWSDPAGTPVLLHILRELERLGYQATAGVFSAREIGAPHRRKRVFILGARHDLTHDQCKHISSLLDNSAGLANARNHSGRGADMAHTQSNGDQRDARPMAQEEGATKREKQGIKPHNRSEDRKLYRTAPPAPRGAEQYAWEPPRVTHNEPQAKSPLGRGADGPSRGLGYAELCYAVDNRTDELRALGNGVVPDTAARAFRVLWARVAHAAR